MGGVSCVTPGSKGTAWGYRGGPGWRGPFSGGGVRMPGCCLPATPAVGPCVGAAPSPKPGLSLCAVQRPAGHHWGTDRGCRSPQAVGLMLRCSQEQAGERCTPPPPVLVLPAPLQRGLGPAAAVCLLAAVPRQCFIGHCSPLPPQAPGLTGQGGWCRGRADKGEWGAGSCCPQSCSTSLSTFRPPWPLGTP